MTVAHTTVLSYLGKSISFQYPVPVAFDRSGFMQRIGKVIAVCVELDGDHQLCIDFGKDDAHFFSFTDLVIQS